LKTNVSNPYLRSFYTRNQCRNRNLEQDHGSRRLRFRLWLNNSGCISIFLLHIELRYFWKVASEVISWLMFTHPPKKYRIGKHLLIDALEWNFKGKFFFIQRRLSPPRPVQPFNFWANLIWCDGPCKCLCNGFKLRRLPPPTRELKCRVVLWLWGGGR
jgi:hypothetical protein